MATYETDVRSIKNYYSKKKKIISNTKTYLRS